ncbi:MAG TPA: hypothetical protein VD865_07940 [Stenotrophomonas sp.]|nr:hypothetical protein [Stenotrophomonas sp.]
MLFAIVGNHQPPVAIEIEPGRVIARRRLVAHLHRLRVDGRERIAQAVGDIQRLLVGRKREAFGLAPGDTGHRGERRVMWPDPGDRMREQVHRIGGRAVARQREQVALDAACRYRAAGCGVRCWLIEHQQLRAFLAEHVQPPLRIHLHAMQAVERCNVDAAQQAPLRDVDLQHTGAARAQVPGGLNAVMPDIGVTRLRIDDELVRKLRQRDAVQARTAVQVVVAQAMAAFFRQQQDFGVHGSRIPWVWSVKRYSEVLAAINS